MFYKSNQFIAKKHYKKKIAILNLLEIIKYFPQRNRGLGNREKHTNLPVSIDFFFYVALSVVGNYLDNCNQ